MTDTNKMTPGFLNWFATNYPCTDKAVEHGDLDARGNQNIAWTGWQASRQAVVVELPSFDGYRDFVVRELQAAFTGACEAQGLRVGVKS